MDSHSPKTYLHLAAALACSLVAAGCRSTPGPVLDQALARGVELDPRTFVVELDRIASSDLWPGFDLRRVPVAVFDGIRTLLFRHPSPPDGFLPDPAGSGAWVFPGRHSALTANKSVEIGGVQTAVALLSNPAIPLREKAAVVVHEAFHVFQGERYPGWVANEVELFAYPVDDSRLLALRRLESMALGRAVATDDPGVSACWTRSALASRRQRFSLLPAGSVEYERKTELKEGLARYVQWRAAGEGMPSDKTHPPEAIRERGYESGASLALLLDRFSPAWKSTLERADTLALDMLFDSVPMEIRSSRCDFAPSELARVDSTAADDVRQLHSRRAALRQRFLTQPGWRLVISAESPLFPQEFDPLNVQMLASGEVLHTRYIRLGNRAGSLEVFGRSSMTEAAGAHPLFNGVRSLTVTGLPAEPVVTDAEGTVTVQGDGVKAEFRGGTIQRSDQTVAIRLTANR